MIADIDMGISQSSKNSNRFPQERLIFYEITSHVYHPRNDCCKKFDFFRVYTFKKFFIE